MKKYNLEDTWKFCLQMWKWIAKQKFSKRNLKLFDEVHAYKKAWLQKHGFNEVIIVANCLFCHYHETHNGNEICEKCPAKKIDKHFHCYNIHEYDFRFKPIKFYAKIKELNKIRLKRKKK